jgi:hypothetical protein
MLLTRCNQPQASFASKHYGIQYSCKKPFQNLQDCVFHMYPLFVGHKAQYMRSEIFMAVKMMIVVFSVVTPRQDYTMLQYRRPQSTKPNKMLFVMYICTIPKNPHPFHHVIFNSKSTYITHTISKELWPSIWNCICLIFISGGHDKEVHSNNPYILDILEI